MKKHLYLYLLLLILPAILLVTSKRVNDARGPFWLSANSDPDYVYLLNSANMAEFEKVGHIDHPGTPVQLIGAVTIRLAHYFYNPFGDTFHADIAKRPEFFLHVINKVLVLLNFLLFFLLGAVAFHLTKDFGAALILQLTPFIAESAMIAALSRVNPEPLLMIATSFLILVLLYALRSERISTFKFILMGFIVGFGIAAKITFIPLAIIPLFFFDKIKNKLVYILSSVIGFVFFTLPIITQYNKFFGWIFRLITREGRYGTGKEEIFSLATCFKNTKKILNENTLFAFLLVLSLVILLIGVLIPALRKLSLKNKHFRLIAGVTAAQIVAIIMVSKNPGQHYLVPAFSLMGFSLYLFYFYILDVVQGFEIKKHFATVPIYICIIAMVFIQNPSAHITQEIKTRDEINRKSALIYSAIEIHYKDWAKVFYYGSSLPEYALKFGNDLALNRFADVLNSLYKDVYFYDFIEQDFFTFSYNERVPFRKLQTQYEDRIVFQGLGSLEIPGVKMKSLPGKYNGLIFLLDQKQGSVFKGIQEWMVSKIPAGSSIVAPVDAALRLDALQDNYNVALVDIKRLGESDLSNLSVFLDKSYFVIPSANFYGKNTLHPKFIERLNNARNLINIEGILPDEQKPQFYVGQLKNPGIPLSTTGFTGFPVWNKSAKEINEISPAIDTLDNEGKFNLAFSIEKQTPLLTVTMQEAGTGSEKSFCLLGYMANKKGLNVDIAKVDRVYFVATVHVTDSLINPKNHLFIQDFSNDWEREKVFFEVPGRMTVVVSKRIRPQSSKLLMGFRFTPSNPGDRMVIEDAKVFIRYK